MKGMAGYLIPLPSRLEECNQQESTFELIIYTQASGHTNRMKPLLLPVLIVSYRLWPFPKFAIFSGIVLQAQSSLF